MTNLLERPVVDSFAFQTGEWAVSHRKLRQRLAGCDSWIEFGGTCRAWEVMGGAANIEDNILDDPDGAYRAAAFRRFDRDTKLWSIWWADERFPDFETPVRGRFENNVGTFFADERLNGRPIKVRFVWSDISGDRARWTQAFSDDGGRSWEVNWIMQFQRTAAAASLRG